MKSPNQYLQEASPHVAVQYFMEYHNITIYMVQFALLHKKLLLLISKEEIEKPSMKSKDNEG